MLGIRWYLSLSTQLSHRDYELLKRRHFQYHLGEKILKKIWKQFLFRKKKIATNFGSCE